MDNWINVNDKLPDKYPVYVTNFFEEKETYNWIADRIMEDPNKPSMLNGKYCAFVSEPYIMKIWAVTHWREL